MTWIRCVVAVLAWAVLMNGPLAAQSSAQVVVFPLEAQDVPDAVAAEVTTAIGGAVGGVDGFEVINLFEAEQRLGVNLTQQARACGEDAFCLVEVGEIIEAATVVRGSIRKRSDSKPAFELKLIAVDVRRAAVAEALTWRFDDAAMTLPAGVAAGRRLFAPRDARVTVRLEPPSADLFLYGESQAVPSNGDWITWSGEYMLRVQAEGYLPNERRWKIAPGPSTLTVALNRDPLHVRSVVTQDEVSPGGEQDRGDIVITTPAHGRPSRFARPWPWVTAGVGAAAVVAGTVVMASAQADYNALANEARFTGDTTQAFVAIDARDDANRRFQVGGGLVVAGAAVLVGGLIWLFVGPGEDVQDRSSITERAPSGRAASSATATAEQRRAARGLVRTLQRAH